MNEQVRSRRLYLKLFLVTVSQYYVAESLNRPIEMLVDI